VYVFPSLVTPSCTHTHTHTHTYTYNFFRKELYGEEELFTILVKLAFSLIILFIFSRAKLKEEKKPVKSLWKHVKQKLTSTKIIG
jgi:hypothetical protein